MNDEEGVAMTVGFVIGLFVMGMFWFLFSHIAETDKVNNGYLTYKGKIYSVQYYSEPDYPVKLEGEKEND